jgi:uncharacterized protein (TIGR02996 family)
MSLANLLAHLQTLPDDWPSWLVYADMLSERGDERGLLLVLAHQLDMARATATSDKHDALRAELETRELEWLTLHLDPSRHLDDLHARCLALAPLGRGTQTPADLVGVFRRPTSQLLALVDIEGEDAEREEPAVFAAHLQQVRAAVIAWIDRAFDGVPPPDDAHRTLHQAEAADSYETCDRSRDHLGPWQQLPEEQLLANQWALAHLDEQGIRYYAPAVMTFALRQSGRHPDDHWLTESFEYTLEPSGPELRSHQQQRFSLLDRAQRAAIYAYTVARGHDSAMRAWARVFEGEREGARDDWFSLFSPGP